MSFHMRAHRLHHVPSTAWLFATMVRGCMSVMRLAACMSWLSIPAYYWLPLRERTARKSAAQTEVL